MHLKSYRMGSQTCSGKYVMKSATEHYNQDYFIRQKTCEDLRSAATAQFFKNFIPAGSEILDFGCGGDSPPFSKGNGVAVDEL